MNSAFLLLAVALAADLDRVLSDPGVARAMALIEQSREEAIVELVKLTEIPAPPFGEETRGLALMERFRSLGLSQVWKDEEGNVFGERPGKGGGPTLVLSAHLDTVFPPRQSTCGNAFLPTVRHGNGDENRKRRHRSGESGDRTRRIRGGSGCDSERQYLRQRSFDHVAGGRDPGTDQDGQRGESPLILGGEETLNPTGQG